MSNTTHYRGYTLLELMVSLGIFSMVMLVVMGAYVSLISLDRQARANNQLAASLSFAVESMARSMRTGSEYVCGISGPNCESGQSRISFCAEGADCRSGGGNDLITYLLKADGSIGQCTGSPCNDSTAVSLTDPRIDIDSLTFYVRGVGSTDYVQPNVTFSISGSMTAKQGETATFSIQTGATQRIIDI